MATKIIALVICLHIVSSDIDDIYKDVTLQGPTKVRVRPSTSSATESIRCAPDPRGQNSIITDDAGVERWRIVSKIGNQLLDWPLTLSLDPTTYGFQPNAADSAVAITMRGFCELTSECDAFFAIAIGDRYFSLATDFDGGIITGEAHQRGVQVYPACGQALATGDPSGFLGQATGDTPSDMWLSLRKVLSEGDNTQWGKLRDVQADNGENFPITLELINNDIDDTFTLRFGSDTFKRGNQLECVYDGAAPTNSEIKVFMTNDWPVVNNEIIVIKSFTINGNKFRKEEEEDEQLFAVQKSIESQEDGSKNVVEIVGLLIVVMVIGVILNRYCFVGDENVKVLQQETHPLLINVQ